MCFVISKPLIHIGRGFVPRYSPFKFDTLSSTHFKNQTQSRIVLKMVGYRLKYFDHIIVCPLN